MKSPFTIMFALACAAVVAAVPAVVAQNGQEEDDTPRFVVRISRPFLAQLIEKTFVSDEPVHDVILGATVEGTAHVDGQYNVKLQEDNKINNFMFTIHGTVFSRTTARRGRIVVQGEGQAEFHAVRPVTFTGKEFVGQPVEMTVSLQSRLGEISTARGGPFSRLVGRIAYPSVVRSMPEADSIAEAKMRAHLSAAATQDSDKILVTLNRVTSVANTIVLWQKVRGLSLQDLPIQLAASDQYLLMGMAAHEQALTDLPVLREEDRAPMEVWVRRLAKKNELNPVPELRLYWLALGPVLKNRLSLATDLAQALDYIHVTELDDWRVVRLYPSAVKMQATLSSITKGAKQRPNATAAKTQPTSVESKSAAAR
jgi:hypothetical protein